MPSDAESEAVPKQRAAGKKYIFERPEKIEEGTILTDLKRGQWRIGPSIGSGGFGEVYAACRVGDPNNNAVVKCEPHDNGPLFVEMHFYLRNAKLADINKFKLERGLKSLGIPSLLANGTANIGGQKQRFLVLPRYGSDVAKIYRANGKRLSEATVYRLALQMLDAFEFIHSKGFVHADLKAANILLGLGEGGASQAYLLDFGLASRYATGDFKPNVNKMHNGTIEYTSRDAHLGVATRRSDLETLGYNLIEWLGVELPWVKHKLLASPPKVQEAKEQFMADVVAALEALFDKVVPVSILNFMKYVAEMSHNQAPDYKKCRDLFFNVLKVMNVSNSGKLDFQLTLQDINYGSPPCTSRAAAAKRAHDEVFAGDAEKKPDENDAVFDLQRQLKNTKPTSKTAESGLDATKTKDAAASKKRAAGTAATAISPTAVKKSRSSTSKTKDTASSSNKRAVRTAATAFSHTVYKNTRSRTSKLAANRRAKKEVVVEDGNVDGNSRPATTSNDETPVGRVILRLLDEQGSSSSPEQSTGNSPPTHVVTKRKHKR